MQCFKVSVRNRLAIWFALAVAAGPPLARGDITYTLNINPSNSAQEQQIANSVAEAVSIYNTYGSFNKHWWINYTTDTGTTANANYEGWVVFGTQRTTRTALHEGAHTLGMGTFTGVYPNDTGPSYSTMISGGVWKGEYGNQAQFDTYNANVDGLHGDGHAIWPGGMNYESEFTDNWVYRVWMVRIQAGIRCDMGIMAFSKEAENELVHPGETAEFSVETPVGTSFQWYKNAAPLSDGGDISGATRPTLRIANADVSDQGEYYCRSTGAGETLNSRPRQLFVKSLQQLGQWDMENNVLDSINTNDATAYGSPAYDSGKIGQAIVLDGNNDYLTLPAAVGYAKDMTVATWVNWNGNAGFGDTWQRIFDFGNNTYQYMFLTPKSGSGTLRLAFLDSINGVSSEQYIDTTVLPTTTWVHLAAVLNGGYATLYVNGRAVGSTAVPVTDPSDFLPTLNYIGKSQWGDPLFYGRIDDFRVYNHALDGSEVWDLWGQSANTAPVFTTNEVVLPAAVAFHAYAAPTLADYVYDADGDSLSYSKIDGPAWLTVAANGTLSGTPDDADAGDNVFHVRAMDPSGASSDMELRIHVGIDFTTGPVAYWDFNDGALGAANGAALPDSASYTVWRAAATDKSGNGNNLTTWESAWAGFTWSTTSQQGDFSIVAAGSYPAAYTWSDKSVPTGIDAEAVVLSNFTVEALTTTTGSGYRTVVGRDARHVSTTDQSLAAFYLGLNPDNHPLARMTDEKGATVEVIASSVTVPNDDSTWYHLAAVRRGDTLSLYVNGVLEDTDTVTGLGALERGRLNQPEWHKGGWSVGRGLYAGGHTDRWFGHIDAVAISGVALSPGQFVITGTWPTGYEFYVEDHGIPGAPFEGDWNSNGVANGMEYFLGWDPTDPLPAPSILTWSADLLSVSYPFNPFARGVTGTVEWTPDLATGIWTDAGVTYATNTSIGEIEANLGTATTNQQLFLRFKVQQ